MMVRRLSFSPLLFMLSRRVLGRDAAVVRSQIVLAAAAAEAPEFLLSHLALLVALSPAALARHEVAELRHRVAEEADDNHDEDHQQQQHQRRDDDGVQGELRSVFSSHDITPQLVHILSSTVMGLPPKQEPAGVGTVAVAWAPPGYPTKAPVSATRTNGEPLLLSGY